MTTINLSMTQICTLPIPNAQWSTPSYTYAFQSGIVMIWFVGSLGAIAIIRPNGEWCFFRSIWGGTPTPPSSVRFDGERIYYATASGFGVIPIPTTFVNGAFFQLMPFDFYSPTLPSNITKYPAGIAIIDGPWISQNGVGYHWHVGDSCSNIVNYFTENAWINKSSQTITVSNGTTSFQWENGYISPMAGHFIAADNTYGYEYYNFSEFLGNVTGTLTSCPNPQYQFSITRETLGIVAHNLVGGAGQPLATDNNAVVCFAYNNSFFLYSRPYGISQMYENAYALTHANSAISNGYLYSSIEASASKMYVFRSTILSVIYPLTNNKNLYPMQNNSFNSGGGNLTQLANTKSYLINHSRPISAIGAYKS